MYIMCLIIFEYKDQYHLSLNHFQNAEYPIQDRNRNIRPLLYKEVDIIKLFITIVSIFLQRFRAPCTYCGFQRLEALPPQKKQRQAAVLATLGNSCLLLSVHGGFKMSKITEVLQFFQALTSNEKLC